MKGDLTIRTVRTASGATAVQVIQYANNKRVVLKHIGSAHTDDELAILRCEAERVCEQLSPQLSLFPSIESPVRLMHMDHLTLQSVTHCFAYEALKKCSQLCVKIQNLCCKVKPIRHFLISRENSISL